MQSKYLTVNRYSFVNKLIRYKELDQINCNKSHLSITGQSSIDHSDIYLHYYIYI